MATMNWRGLDGEIGAKTYVCPYCGKDISTTQHLSARSETNGIVARISICHNCKNPTYFSADGKQVPGSPVGKDIEGLEDAGIIGLYREARDCLSVSAYTASILCSRKLLMSIAVSKGAKPGDTFQNYVGHLERENYVPPGSHDWVDHIRTKGNEATHEIALMTKADAEELIKFIEMLLVFIWEFPYRVSGKVAKP